VAVELGYLVVPAVGLPEVYEEGIYKTKCDATYQHVYDAYYGGGDSLYADVA
jgi:hypothetical protein